MATTKKQTNTAPSATAEAVKREVIRKKFSGIAVSDKMDKTIVVKVEVVKIHPKYHKRFVVSRKFKVHDERNHFKTGDSVTFVSCRPMSKDKKWRVLYQ